MTAASATSYDEVPYDSLPFAESHPDTLATVAALLGMTPPPITRCRVLELGCAGGGNLIPMACGLPDSQFLGIDLSQRQIADGHAALAAMGLRNIELRHLSIMDVGEDFGTFDYILAHGVYSWVPPEVQEKTLAICRKHLAPQGVAYVSFNTQPGWHTLGILREMMGFHIRRLTAPAERMAAARNLLDFLGRSLADKDAAWAGLLRPQMEEIRSLPDHYLYHDHLEDRNEPLYFHEFAERIAQHELQYLGESNFAAMWPDNFRPETVKELHRAAASVVEIEQSMDCLRNRMFRQTLLCHAGVRVQRSLDPGQIAKFFIASGMRPEAEAPDVQSPVDEKFVSPQGLGLVLDDPLLKAALVYLAKVWPRAVPFEELRAAVRSLLAIDETTRLTPLLGARLLRCFTTSVAELHVYAPSFEAAVSERPVAHPWARYLATHGGRIANVRHEIVDMNDLGRALIPLLDGTRDRAGLRHALRGRQDDNDLEALVDQALKELASSAILIG